MRVLLVSAHFRPHVGGVERFAESLADGLVRRGHDVCVVCCRTDPDSPLVEAGRYRVVRIPSATWPERRFGVPYPVPAPGALASTLRAELARAEVVHVQDALYATSVAALALARRRRVPAVLTQHVAFVPQRRAVLDVAQRAAVATLGRAARLATRVVTYNAEVATWAERRWKLSDVRVLPVGVAPVRARDRDAARAELGLERDRFVALFVGRDVPKKGLDLVLAAADPAYDVVAVTDRTGASPHGATLVPFGSSERLHRLYAAADAFVLPSVAEGIPFALQEAMAHGLPVIATYTPGYASSFTRDDVLAVERDPRSIRDALHAVAADEALRARLAARSRTLAETVFSLDAFVGAYERTYEDVVRNSQA